MKEKLKAVNIVKMIINIIAVLTLLLIVFLNAKYEVTIRRFEEHTDIQNMGLKKLLIDMLIGIGIVVLTNWISRFKINKIAKRIVIIVLLGIYIIFQVVWVQYCMVNAGADSEMIYGAASRLFNHKEITDALIEYFAYYKQNIGLVVIFEKLMYLFQTDNINLFRYANVVSNVFTVLGLYWIYHMITNDTNKRNEILFYILALGFLPMSLLCTWVYGDFIGLALSVWAVAFIIKYQQSKKTRYFIFSSLSMAFAIMSRSNSNIFIIAIAIYLILTISEEKTKKEKILKLVLVPIFILIAIMPNKILMSYVSNKYQMNDKKEKSVIVYLYMGMSEGNKANGWFNDEIAGINREMKLYPKDDKTIENQTKEKLKNRVQYLFEHSRYTMEFYKNKILSMWAEPTMASEIYNTQRGIEPSDNKMFVLLMEGQNFEILKSSQKIIDGIIFTGALLCCILKRKNISNERLLLAIVFLGGFSFHILWEAKSRYIIPYVAILIPIAVVGMSELSEWIKIKIRKNKRNNKKLLKEGESKNEKNICNNTNVL